MSEPERVCREMCEFAEEKFSDAMLDREARTRTMFIPAAMLQQFHPNTTRNLTTEKVDRVDRWRDDLSREDLVLIEHVIGPELERYGYRRSITRRSWRESTRLSVEMLGVDR